MGFVRDVYFSACDLMGLFGKHTAFPVLREDYSAGSVSEILVACFEIESEAVNMSKFPEDGLAASA
jgi:hypothetical protein